MYVAIRNLSLLLLLLFLLCCCTAAPTPAEPTPAEPTRILPLAEPPQPHLFTLLSDRRLLVIRPSDGQIEAELRLGVAAATESSNPGHDMAFSRARDRLFVLVAGAAGSPDRVAEIHTEALTITRSFSLPSPDVRYSSLAVGPITGRIYLFGARVEPQIPVAPSSQAPHAMRAVVTVLDAERGTVAADWPLRESQGYDWLIYQGAVSADEQTIFVSYHGSSTTGIDWYSIAGQQLIPCDRPAGSGPNRGCINAHGGFLLRDADLLVATGERELLAVDRNNTVRATWDTHLENNHLMEFALDSSQKRLYAVGACGYGPGFRSIDLATAPGATAASVLPQPTTTAPGEICGGRITFVDDTLLATTKTSRVVASPTSPGAVLFIDARGGAIVRTVTTPAEPIDVIASKP